MQRLPRGDGWAWSSYPNSAKVVETGVILYHVFTSQCLLVVLWL